MRFVSLAAAVVLGLVPFGWWCFLAFTDGLGANPAQYLTLSSGEWSLVGLCLVLAATPLQRWLGVSWPLRHRRTLGLFTFFYATLHALAWAFWEQGLVLSAMWSDVVTRLFITVGVVAFILMAPLAITSTNGWLRRLGRNWKRLHLLVYPALGMSVWHFWLVRAGKNDFAEVRIYIGIALVLVAFKWAHRIRSRHRAGVTKVRPGTGTG